MSFFLVYLSVFILWERSVVDGVYSPGRSVADGVGVLTAGWGPCGRLVHFYLGNKGLMDISEPPEVYALNECVGLSAGLSLRNPQNFEAYVAGEFSHHGD